MSNFNKLKEIVSPIAQELIEFEIKLREIINKNEFFLKDELNDFLFRNPKRLRPIFVFAFAKILKINHFNVCDIALAIELVHNASLFHDDIIDEEKERRESLTFFEKYGAKTSLLKGDLLLSLSLEVLANTSVEIVNIFSHRITKTILGEIKQNKNINKCSTIEEYYEKSFSKTSNLFLVGLESLFILKKIENNVQISLKEFLEKFSLAFQIKNDLDNFNNSKTDLKNGNYTLPVLYCVNKKDEHENVIKKVENEILVLKNEALACLEKIENSQYKDLLISISDYVLGR